MLARPELPSGCAAGLLCALCAYAAPYTVDDAHIVARYATRLARGLGYTFNDGPATDGVTSPLWLGLCAVAAWLGADPLAAGKGLGAVATALAGALLVRVERGRALGRAGAWWLCGLLVTSAPLVTWAGAGLETGLATLALCVVLAQRLRREGPQRGLLYAALGAVPWLRPELVPFAWAVAAPLLARPALRRGVLAGAAGGLLSVAAFRYGLFGHVWPMTAAAKPGLLVHGARYAFDALRPPASLALAVIAAASALWVRGAAGLALALALHGAAVLLAGGDWMPAARLFVPVLPCAALLGARVLCEGLRTRPRLALCLGGGLVVVRAAALAVDLDAAHGADAPEAVLAAVTRALPPRGPLVALDIGWLGARTPCRIIDLGGLTEPRIAYAPGAHLDKRVDSAWLEREAPTAILLHSAEAPRVDGEGRLRWFAGYGVERRVLAFPWVLRGYRVTRVFRYGERYFYVLLVRTTARDS